MLGRVPVVLKVMFLRLKSKVSLLRWLTVALQLKVVAGTSNGKAALGILGTLPL